MTDQLIWWQRHCRSTYLVTRRTQDMQQHSMHCNSVEEFLSLPGRPSKCLSHIALGPAWETKQSACFLSEVISIRVLCLDPASHVLPKRYWWALIPKWSYISPIIYYPSVINYLSITWSSVNTLCNQA